MSLPIPSTVLDIPFGQVLDHRRSHRRLLAPSRGEIAALLWHGARSRGSEQRPHGYRWETRASPSGGGIHPIHFGIFRLGREVRAWRYDPVRHALVPLPFPAQRIAQFLEDVCTVVEGSATVLVALADSPATERWYLRSESVVQRDAGCALQVLHMVATGLGLGSCLLGLRGDRLRVRSAGRRLLPLGVLLVGRVTTDRKG